MRYTFVSTNKQGKKVIGDYEADSRAAVVDYLEKRHLTPLDVRLKTAEGEGWNIALFEHITTLDRITLTRNLAATSKAGLSLIESLDILAEDAGKNILKTTLSSIRTNVANGQPLWQSFAFYGQHFPPFFIGMVRAAETSGQMDSTLSELTTYLTREYNLVKKVQAAMAYPLVLITASMGVLALLMGFVLPRVEETFERSRIELPIYTRVLLEVSHAMRYSLVLDLVLLSALIFVIFVMVRNAKAKRLATQALFSVPLVRDLLKKIALVRFARTLGSLLSSGVLITEGLKLAGESVGNAYYKEVITQVNADVTRGIPLSKALAVYPKLFPHFMVSLIVVGEKTGTLEHILKTFADFYDDEVDYTLKSLTSFLEPVMLLVMGLVIGLIVLSILLPVYQFVGNYL